MLLPVYDILFSLSFSLPSTHQDMIKREIRRMFYRRLVSRTVHAIASYAVTDAEDASAGGLVASHLTKGRNDHGIRSKQAISLDGSAFLRHTTFIVTNIGFPQRSTLIDNQRY